MLVTNVMYVMSSCCLRWILISSFLLQSRLVVVGPLIHVFDPNKYDNGIMFRCRRHMKSIGMKRAGKGVILESFSLIQGMES